MDRTWDDGSKLVLFWGLIFCAACHQAGAKETHDGRFADAARSALTERCAMLDPQDHERWDAMPCEDVAKARAGEPPAALSLGLDAGACYARTQAAQPSWIELSCVLSTSLAAKAAIPLVGGEPNEETLAVVINQEPLARSNWDYDPASRSIVFAATAETPALLKEGNRLVVRYAESFAPSLDEAAIALMPAVVQDARGIDGCQFLLKLADGSLLDPVHLADAFQRDGLAVAVAWRAHGEMPSLCRGSRVVEITELRDEGRSFARDELRCDALSRQFEALVAEIEGLERTCQHTAECEVFGMHPSAACPHPRFTVSHNLTEARRHRLASLSEALLLSCPPPQAKACAVVHPTEVTCGAATQECEGTF